MRCRWAHAASAAAAAAAAAAAWRATSAGWPEVREPAASPPGPQGAGVDGALVVQPGNHLFDHSYVTAVLRQHPGRLVGCLLADPTPGGGGVAALAQLLTQEGYRAVRFNPYLWPEGEKMTNEVGRGGARRGVVGWGRGGGLRWGVQRAARSTACCPAAAASSAARGPGVGHCWQAGHAGCRPPGPPTLPPGAPAPPLAPGGPSTRLLRPPPPPQVGRAMYLAAGELGAPVGHMPFKGLLGHLEEVRQLCRWGLAARGQGAGVSWPVQRAPGGPAPPALPAKSAGAAMYLVGWGGAGRCSG
jgi:hypothetical protein